jgi:hypothetical protein
VNVLAWTLSALLAAAFGFIAASKLLQSRRKLLGQPNFEWVEDVTATQLKAIGVVELLGALGLILPALPRIPDVLAPLAAIGLALTMVGAAALHLRRGERSRVPANVLLLVLLVLVAALRLGPAPL